MRQRTEKGQQWPCQIIALAEEQNRRFYYPCKRCLDIVLATLLIIFLSPLLLSIAVLIKLDSPGPIIFVQPRVGARKRKKDGRIVWESRIFSFYKFRSMVHNADQSIHEAHIKAFIEGRLAAPEASTANFKLTNDPRITRVGRILRKTSLDELPQLVNVLKAEMSLVGPRPVPMYEAAGYQAWHCERLAALPGITGLWQVTGRCQVPFDEMVQLDIQYIRTQSLWSDFKLLFLTIPAVIIGRGAE